VSNAQLDAFGAEKSIRDTWEGIKQLYAGVADRVAPRPKSVGSLVSGQDNSRSAQIQQEIDRQRQEDAPLMATTPGYLGNVGGQIAQLAVPVGDVAKGLSITGKLAPIINSAATAANFAGLQPTATGESRGENTAQAAALGAAGQLLPSVLGKAAQATAAKLNPVVQQSIRDARAAGIPLHAAQVTNSRFAKAVSSALNELPFTGAGAAGEKQSAAFHRALSNTFGANAPVLSDQVMQAARNNLSQGYNTIFNRTQIRIDPQNVRSMIAIAKQAESDLTAADAHVVQNQLVKILNDAPNGDISGAKYKSLRGSLQALESNASLGRFVRSMRKELDNAAHQSATPQDSAALKKLDSMWANLRTTEDALKQVSGAAGRIKPAALWPLVRNGSTKEMRALAQMGQNVLKDPIPNSGTPVRQLVYGLGSHQLGLAIPGVAKAVAAGAVAGRTMNSNAVSKLLESGKPINSLARLSQLARPQTLLPAAGRVIVQRKRRGD
jgi:hypothetical protein